MTKAETLEIDPGALLALMRHRRSSRTGFIADKPLSDADLTQLLEAARSAPSGGNAQPWEFIVIRDKEMRNASPTSTSTNCATSWNWNAKFAARLA